MNPKIETARAAFATTELPQTLSADAPESNIQYMPPGRQTITCFVNGQPQKLAFTVQARHAELFNQQLQAMLAKARDGQGDKPLIDYNHEDGAASGRPLRFEWGGDDPKTGGIRLITKLTGKARASIKDEEFDRFSPQWDFDVDTHEPMAIGVNLGGLVNKAAFKTIATVQAKAATARADAVDGDDDGDGDTDADCAACSAAAHKASSKAVSADSENAENAHTDAHKKHLAAMAAMKAAGKDDEAALHKDLAAHHKNMALTNAKNNLAAASAAASNASKPGSEVPTTTENNMTEQEIATAVAKGVEAATKPLGEQITKLNEKINSLEQTNATASAKAAVAKHVARGAIAPQDADSIKFFETAYASDAAGTEAILNKLPVISRGRVIPQGHSNTATNGAADPSERILAGALALKKSNPTAFASDASALAAYLASPQGNAEYAETLLDRSDKRADVRTAR